MHGTINCGLKELGILPTEHIYRFHAVPQ